MDVFVYSRDAPGSEALREDEALAEAHWSYMDAFADSMIARGPTLGSDREAATGSLHVLRLPDAEAARAFVEREPNNRAGVYAEHAVWRFENLLGRTMWDFPRAADEPRFLIVARSQREPVPAEALPPELRCRLILYGALAALEGAEPVGAALAVQAADRRALDALLVQAELGPGDDLELEVHDWEFGGRR